MAIHWYPGHMHKATREMTKILPEVDLVIELLDARLPVKQSKPSDCGAGVDEALHQNPEQI